MTSTLTHSRDASAAVAARTVQPAFALAELREAADRLGQMNVSNPRWPQMEPVLEACLLAAFAYSDEPRDSVLRALATDTHTPLIVKLRTLAMLLRKVS